MTPARLLALAFSLTVSWTLAAGDGLKDLPGAKGRLVGVAVRANELATDPAYRAAILRDYNAINTGNELKFRMLAPKARGDYRFEKADAVVDFAEKNGLAIRGHTLVWHNEVPEWVDEQSLTPKQSRELMVGHIQTVVGRYKGRIARWDVVNEAFLQSGAYRDTIWYRLLGPEYLAIAFQAAHEADPKALLYYNDFGMEVPNKRTDAVLAMVSDFQRRGVPIHGIGSQSHLDISTSYPSAEVRKNIRRFKQVGLEFAITEFDIALKAPVTEADLKAQADLGGAYARDSLLADVEEFTIWGVSDAEPSPNKERRGIASALAYESPGHPKPLYHAIHEAFQKAKPR